MTAPQDDKKQICAATTEDELQQTILQALQQAIKHHEAGQTQSAEELYLAILEISNEHPDANHNLGVLYCESGQNEKAILYLLNAVTIDPTFEQYWISYLEALLAIQKNTTARQTLDLAKSHGLKESIYLEFSKRIDKTLADASPPQKSLDKKKKTFKTPSRQDVKKLQKLQKKGNNQHIEVFSRELIKRYPGHVLGWKTLGTALFRQDRMQDSLRATQKALSFSADDPAILNDIGLIYEKTGRFKEAEFHYEKALKKRSDFPAALCNLGNLLRLQGTLGKSEKLLRQATKLESNSILHINLGATLLEMGRIVDAEKQFRLALKISPQHDLAHINLGVSLRKQGLLDDAIQHQREALRLNPECINHFSHLLFTLNYSSATPDALLNEAKKYGELVEKLTGRAFTQWQYNPNVKTLKIGLVSGDLFNHPVGFFLENILVHLQRENIEIIIYPTRPNEDDLSQRLKCNCSAWTPIHALNNNSAAQLIHKDGIHILIDLSGHTSGNRLPLFSLKPAPVQISWLGYFATTGLKAMDYFLADHAGVPEENQKYFTEKIWYLPSTRLCFSEPKFDIDISPPPARQNGYLTFGSYQQLTKVSDEVLDVWSQIFLALPDFRLRWKCTQLGDKTIREHVLSRLKHFGITEDKVELTGGSTRAVYLESHNNIDLILDSFPYPGGTTTCEALWMGVPTLTLAGNSLISRQGVSLLSACNLIEFVASSKEEYIKKALSFSRDPEKLGKLRSQLRQQVVSSPLFNSSLFATQFSSELHKIWKNHQQERQTETQKNSKKTADKPVMNFFNPVFWGTSDPKRFENLMKEAASLTSAYHFADNMFLFQRNNSMFNDNKFIESWENNVISPPDRTIIWRRYILAMAGFHCQHLEGDFVECGAYQGVGAKTVIDYLGGTGFEKTFWLYDVFEHNEKMVNHSLQAHGPQLYKQVMKRFENYPNVKIFKGFLPEILKQGCPEKIAYLHIDLNQAPAEIATLDALFEKVVPGGMIILDDYEMVFYRAQKLAEDIWFDKHGYKVFPLPTSQGFVIKR